MNEVAYAAILEVVDDAVDLAEDAVKSAETARKRTTPEPVKLVKVAAARCKDVAASLVKSGAFPGKTVGTLTKTLEEGGAATHLELLEKLASRAVFPLDLPGDLDGTLVEKSSTDRMVSDRPLTNTELWAQAWAEAEAENAG
tara:strand:- start:2073 stop:2498 length:426 start_codon:yes stop_codon:yes gene_type:complete